MEGKTSKYSISAWRKNAKEKRNIRKREYYKKNEEKLAEKARERMKRLREKLKLQSETDLKGRGSGGNTCFCQRNFSSFTLSVNVI